MKKIYRFLGVILCLLIYVPGFSQSKLSNGTKIFLASYHDDKSSTVDSTKVFYPIPKVVNENWVKAFVQFKGDIDEDVLNKYNVQVYHRYPKNHMVSSLISINELEAIANDSAIKYVDLATSIAKKMHLARPSGYADKVELGESPLTHPYRGMGVVVGVVDNGLQYTHINFYDSIGNLRIKRVWNQNKYGGTKTPSDFTYGREYTTAADIENANMDIPDDEVGHATHVTGIAAGSDHHDGNDNYGIAQDADLVFVSYEGSDNMHVLDGIDYIFNYAKSINEPAVVNLSLGTHSGPHDGTSLFDQALDSLVGAGKIVCGAAGNEGSDMLHLSKNFTPTDTLLKTFVSFYAGSKLSSLVDIWGDSAFDYTVQVIIYDRINDSILSRTDIFDAMTDTLVKYPYSLPSKISGNIYVGSGKDILNGKGNISVVSILDSLSSKYYVGVIIKADSGTIHLWADDVNSFLSSKGMVGWSNGNNICSVGEVGGTAKKMITVGAYTTYAKRGYGSRLLKDSIAYFSSHGPTADGRTKPDITAPGAVLISSIPNTSYVLDKADIAYNNEVDGVKYYYGYMMGTSMATPYVTGVIATWLQANPDLTPDDIKDVFKHTAIKDDYTGNSLPNNIWGYGKINAFAGIEYILGLTAGVETTKIASSSMIYPNPTTDGHFSILFKNSDKNVVMNLYTLSGQKVFSNTINQVLSNDVRSFDVSSLTDGVYMVKLTGNKKAETFRLIVNK